MRVAPVGAISPEAAGSRQPFGGPTTPTGQAGQYTEIEYYETGDHLCRFYRRRPGSAYGSAVEELKLKF